MASSKMHIGAKGPRARNSSSADLGVSNDTKNDAANTPNEDDADMCLICAEPIVVAAISPCNHTTCHLCAFRQRKLYGKNQCLFCRSESAEIIFTDNYMDVEFNDVPKRTFLPSFQGDLGIKFTSQTAKDRTLSLLEYRCPVENCSGHFKAFPNFKQLNEHAQSVHSRFFCTTCGNAKKAFPCELKMYTQAKLRLHLKKGDFDGFEGHPSCKFCNNHHFYSDDELNVHMRDAHERCDVCHRMDSTNPQYFKNMEQLSQHFLAAHYPCRVASCLEQKVIVFGDLLELEAHMAKEHPQLNGGRMNFGSHLSSFNSDAKPKSTQKDTHTSLETKRRRFEIRAKHYLSNDHDLYTQFVACNDQFSKHHISALDLQAKYVKIFEHGSNVDIPILLFEFSELFPEGSKERNDLVAVNKANMNAKKFSEAFPTLPVGNKMAKTFGTPISKWNGAPKKATKFPSLASPIPAPTSKAPAWGATNAPKKPIARGITTSAPINGYSVPGYAPVSQKAPKNSTSTLSYSMASASASSSSLLDRPVHAVNSRSLSSLDLSTASWGSTPTQVPTTTRKNNSTAFPSLPKPKPKAKIPRVNPINSSNGMWGSTPIGGESTPSPVDGLSELLDSGLKIKVKPQKNKKK